jgi:anti-anti-sigma factor
MIDFSIDESSSTGTLILSGDVTVQFATVLRETLLEVISNTVKLVLNIEHVERIDLSTVQLLCATHRALKKADKDLIVIGMIPEIVKETISDSGYNDCMSNRDSSGLWSKERN